MTDRFRTAVKKAAEAAPSDLTTFIADTTQRDLHEDASFRPPNGAPKKQHDLEHEFERFMGELVDRGLIEGSQDRDDGDQIILGEVQGMEDWKEVLDSTTQRKYYWNDQTDEVVWEDPRIKDNSGVEPVQQESISRQSCGPSPQAEESEEELIDLFKKLSELQCPVDRTVSDGEQSTHAVDAVKALWVKFAKILQGLICSESICSSSSMVFDQELSQALDRVTSLLNRNLQNPEKDEDSLSCKTSKDNNRTQSD